MISEARSIYDSLQEGTIEVGVYNFYKLMYGIFAFTFGLIIKKWKCMRMDRVKQTKEEEETDKLFEDLLKKIKCEEAKEIVKCARGINKKYTSSSKIEIEKKPFYL